MRCKWMAAAPNDIIFGFDGDTQKRLWQSQTVGEGDEQIGRLVCGESNGLRLKSQEAFILRSYTAHLICALPNLAMFHRSVASKTPEFYSAPRAAENLIPHTTWRERSSKLIPSLHPRHANFGWKLIITGLPVKITSNKTRRASFCRRSAQNWIIRLNVCVCTLSCSLNIYLAKAPTVRSIQRALLQILHSVCHPIQYDAFSLSPDSFLVTWF